MQIKFKLADEVVEGDIVLDAYNSRDEMGRIVPAGRLVTITKVRQDQYHEDYINLDGWYAFGRTRQSWGTRLKRHHQVRLLVPVDADGFIPVADPESVFLTPS